MKIHFEVTKWIFFLSFIDYFIKQSSIHSLFAQIAEVLHLVLAFWYKYFTPLMSTQNVFALYFSNYNCMLSSFWVG
ncbi:MAG: hypothetical protein EAZ55_02050 [Cytophagales bacterium]|nr:MAG: hypothetical protein EAZ55_02050 [Cytophagales bacterium]